MELYTEEYPAGAGEPIYPINAVRNRALQIVATQVICVLNTLTAADAQELHSSPAPQHALLSA